MPPLKPKRPKVEPFSLKGDLDTFTEHSLNASVFLKNKSPSIEISFLTPVHACENGRFPLLDAAIIAVCDEEEGLGHKWVKGQTKKTRGEVRRITMHCNHYCFATEQHFVAIDPANHRQGRSNKTNCKAHVNIIRDPEMALWVLNVLDCVHNHAPDIPFRRQGIVAPNQEGPGCYINDCNNYEP